MAARCGRFGRAVFGDVQRTMFGEDDRFVERSNSGAESR
jgi:hypothetical protein